MAVLIVANENAAQILRRRLPIIPEINGNFGGRAIYLGTPNIEGGTVPRRVAFASDFSEAQIDVIRALATSLNALNLVSLEDELPEDWVIVE